MSTIEIKVPNIGEFKDAIRYLDIARPICIDLNESLMMGKLFTYEAKYYENIGNYNSSLECYRYSIAYRIYYW